jgi:hypothetical protein
MQFPASPKNKLESFSSFNMSSEDSAGSDSSFDSEDDNDSDTPFRLPDHIHNNHHHNNNDNNNNNNDSLEASTIENPQKALLDDLKFKHQRYTQYTKRIYQKSRELEQDKSSSMWCSLYYTFFNNSMHSSIVTLNELNLRCKFLFNMDKIEKETKRNSSSQNNHLRQTPLTNISSFLKYFADKNYDHPTRPKTTIALRGRASSKQKNIQFKDNSEPSNVTPNQNRNFCNILKMYNIKEPNEIVANVNRKTGQFSKDKSMKKKIENMNYILNNKHAYQVEMENFKRTMSNNVKIKRLYDEFLDLKQGENFFANNVDVDLVKKYENKLEEEEKLGAQVNMFCEKVINKIDPFYKLDF